MAKTLTSANAILTLTVQGLLPATQIQRFMTDDIFDADAVDVAETVMGADAFMSAGWIPQIKKLNVSLQADSDSIDFFEQWYQGSQAVQDIYWASGTIFLRSVQKKYTLTRGILRNYKPLPDAKKILQGRKFSIDWENISAAAI